MLLKVCLNGAREPGAHRAVPMSIEECAVDAADCVAAGAAAVHVHPRDSRGRETLDPPLVDTTVVAIREASGVAVGVSTGEWIEPDLTARTMAVHSWTEPDFASVNLSEAGAPEVMAALIDRDIGVEAGIATPGDVDRLVDGGMAEGLLRVLIEPTSRRPAEALATAQAVAAALDAADVQAPRLAHGSGVATWSVLEWATAVGYDLRIGLEDTLVTAGGADAEDNPELVSAAAALIG